MSDWLINYGSWCLAPFGLLGMYVVGRKKTWGWLLSMTTQALWATYAIGTGQYGFLIGTVSYFAVYLRNWLDWRRQDRSPSSVRDISEGSRVEITGIDTIDDASRALRMILDKRVPVDAPFHCYLNGPAFSVWTTGKEDQA